MKFEAIVGAAPDAVGEVSIGKFLQVPLGDLEDGLDVLVGQIVDRDDVAGGGICFMPHRPASLADRVQAEFVCSPAIASAEGERKFRGAVH